jgi:hypothetical protein
MNWLFRFFLNLRPWLVIVTHDSKSPEVFGEYWRESEARRVFEMAKEMRSMREDAPVNQYQLVSRSEWNRLRVS